MNYHGETMNIPCNGVRVADFESPAPITAYKYGHRDARHAAAEIAAKADAEIAALKARIRELTEWRPMDTAPKDGTEILLCRKLDRLVIVGLWHDGHGEWIDGEYIAPIACPDFWIPISELPWLPGSEAP